MATTVDIAGTNISARQMSEFYRLVALPGSHVNRDTFQAYLERRNAFVFERNEHGHIVIAFTGLDLTGEQDCKRLKAAGYRVSASAKSCFTSTADDSYDKHHRLVAGRLYRVALVPGREILRDSDRTTTALRKLGRAYGYYDKPLGGHIPRIREAVSNTQMEEMGIQYIVSPHDPIRDSVGRPGVLYADRGGDDRLVSAYWHDPAFPWFGDGAFAFPVP